MKLGPSSAERQEDFGSDENHRKGGGERDPAGEQPEASQHGDEPDPDPGDELQPGSRRERRSECGIDAVGDSFTGRPKLGSAMVDPAERSQGGQTAEQLEGTGRQR